jgi:hypothetical protein
MINNILILSFQSSEMPNDRLQFVANFKAEVLDDLYLCFALLLLDQSAKTYATHYLMLSLGKAACFTFCYALLLLLQIVETNLLSKLNLGYSAVFRSWTSFRCHLLNSAHFSLQQCKFLIYIRVIMFLSYFA